MTYDGMETIHDEKLCYTIHSKNGKVTVELSIENFYTIFNNHLLMEKILKEIQGVSPNAGYRSGRKRTTTHVQTSI